MKKYILDDQANKDLRARICAIENFSDEEAKMILRLARNANQSRFSDKKLAPAVMNMITDGITLIESSTGEQREDFELRFYKLADLITRVTSLDADDTSATVLEGMLKEIKLQAKLLEIEFESFGPSRTGQFFSGALLVLSLLAAAAVIASAVLTAPISLPVMAGTGAAATAINAGLAAGTAIVAANQVAVGAAAATGLAAGITGLVLSRDKSPRFKFSAEKVVDTLADDVTKLAAPTR